jgi:hypothetical protein
MQSNSGFSYKHFVCKRYYYSRLGWRVKVFDTHENELHTTEWHPDRTLVDNLAKKYIDRGFDSPF